MQVVGSVDEVEGEYNWEDVEEDGEGVECRRGRGRGDTCEDGKGDEGGRCA